MNPARESLLPSLRSAPDRGSFKYSIRTLFVGVLLVTLAQPAVAGFKGDLNDDGVVDTSDATILLGMIKGNIIPSELADVAPIVGIFCGNGGDPDAADLLIMLRAIQEDDVDYDTLSTAAENAQGTSPFLFDTDADGADDATDSNPTTVSTPNVPLFLRIFDQSGGVLTTWEHPGVVSQYVVHRYGTDDSYEFVVVDGSLTSFLDTTAQSGVVYRYWVEAVNTSGHESTFVNCDLTSPDHASQWMTGALGAIPNPYYSAVEVGGLVVSFTWEASADPTATSYKIFEYTGASPPPSLGDSTGFTERANVTANPDPGTGLQSHSISVGGTGTHYFRMTVITPSGESNLDSAKQIAIAVN